jgi:outer membrane lipoprotein SlyB
MTKKIVTILLMFAVSLSVVFIGGCESDAQTGALIGAGVGALAGQAIGGDTEGTLIGAGVGAAGGYIIGNEQDKKKQ